MATVTRMDRLCGFAFGVQTPAKEQNQLERVNLLNPSVQNSTPVMSRLKGVAACVVLVASNFFSGVGQFVLAPINFATDALHLNGRVAVTNLGDNLLIGLRSFVRVGTYALGIFVSIVNAKAFFAKADSVATSQKPPADAAAVEDDAAALAALQAANERANTEVAALRAELEAANTAAGAAGATHEARVAELTGALATAEVAARGAAAAQRDLAARLATAERDAARVPGLENRVTQLGTELEDARKEGQAQLASLRTQADAVIGERNAEIATLKASLERLRTSVAPVPSVVAPAAPPAPQPLASHTPTGTVIPTVPLADEAALALANSEPSRT